MSQPIKAILIYGVGSLVCFFLATTRYAHGRRGGVTMFNLSGCLLIIFAALSLYAVIAGDQS